MEIKTGCRIQRALLRRIKGGNQVEKYIGVKIIQAEKADRAKGDKRVYLYTEPRPSDEEYEDGYKIVYPDGYVSWSPKDVFEEAYRKTDGLTFGLAVEALKKGLSVARKGWNGKGMFLILIGAPGCESWSMEDEWSHLTPNIELASWIGMKTADEKFVPWLASQTDVLAEDWTIVGEQ